MAALTSSLLTGAPKVMVEEKPQNRSFNTGEKTHLIFKLLQWLPLFDFH